MSDEAPGWAAIDAALERIYPGVEPRHYGTIIKWALGGSDPLDGMSFYRRPDHWHLVGYGLTELYTKESDDSEVSGWGFELTMRVRAGADDPEPIWAANLMQNLARYVCQTGNIFEPGHHMDLNGPINLDTPDTAIRAVAFALDPELGAIDSPHGRLEFLQIVGLTLDEYAACQGWQTTGVLDALAAHLPMLVTDVHRDSLLAVPAVAAAIDEGTRRDGSSTGSLYVAESRWTRADGQTTLTFGANGARAIAAVLSGRLGHDRGLAIAGPDQQILLRPGDRLEVSEITDDTIELVLPPPAAMDMTNAIRPIAGRYPLPSAPDIAIVIVKSQIRDQAGNVIREVG